MTDNVKNVLWLREEVFALRDVRSMAFVGFKQEVIKAGSACGIEQKLKSYKVFENYLKTKESELDAMRNNLTIDEQVELALETQ